MIRFTLYGRAWCHLCDEMRDALEAALACAIVSSSSPVDYYIDVIDIDAVADVDPDLAAGYDELVPVLIAQRPGGEPEQLCHYFLDPARLHAFLAG
jgi:hypothetical protein